MKGGPANALLTVRPIVSADQRSSSAWTAQP